MDESSFVGLSWAEEVEREEQQEKEKEKQSKRCDPFGAARPREVILEEKGVDWKKLDHDFSFDSSAALRECKTKAIAIKKPLETHKLGRTLPSKQSVPCEEPEHEPAPPLKYPPKNIDSVFEEIHRERKILPEANPNVKPNDRYCVENRIPRGSKVKQVSTNCSNRLACAAGPHQPRTAWRVSKLPKNENTLSSLNTVLVAKEKTGSNFERRPVLAELNNTGFSRKKKAPCSNSYYGVLELLEPSSHDKLNAGSARKRGATEEEELEHNVGAGAKSEAAKKNREKPTVSKRRKEKRRSKK